MAQRIGWDRLAWLATYIGDQQGYADSLKSSSCIDAKGSPIPWYTYPSIEFLDGHDFSDLAVFEYGSGNSSLYWAARASQVWSVEDDSKWYESINSRRLKNHIVLFRKDQASYVGAIAEIGIRPEIVVVDGNHRFRCAEEAVKHLADDGLLVFDNSDWYPQSTAFLRSRDFLQFNFYGPGPLNAYAWCTSIFVRRSVRLKPRCSKHPSPGVGSLEQVPFTE